ncbi:anthranilate synthase component I [Denitrobaculum tricleocarpae]|uniref:Anthranilate synthase component 1 n=1 Tax=Denitrobaculum tricleocarpae TaxID=2591009 RepID=A0A545TPL7_9PROT|nr:anthranilate synthase component I [Denitrobaculum tricleocarpae]TQV79159.1 anthranilate synthase component I [Denitrobaculum tricleocarpae]
MGTQDPTGLDYDGFARLYESGKAQVVWTTLIADLETPVSAFLKLAEGQPNSVLFESVEGGTNIGRYSFLGFKPDVIWRCRGNQSEINRNALQDLENFTPLEGDALDSLRGLIAESRIDLPQGLPPMASAVIGYLGYETVRLMEHLPDQNPDFLGVPDGMFIRPTVIAIFDRVEDQVTVVTPVWPGQELSTRDAYEAAYSRLAAVVSDFEQPVPRGRDVYMGDTVLPEPDSNVTQAEFHAMVEKAKEYILAGDAFQVVLSQRFSIPFELPPFAFYRALRRINPSPFLFYLNLGEFSIVGSSPEILVRLRDGKVTIRPIAGTRKRGATPQEDKELAADLLSDPKELAEHLMLLDLGRNDVGRVAKVGSVKVTEKMLVELYSHVMHIVSNVDGELDEKYDAMQALYAGFPAGTVSGAPKVRAMEIIDELEPDRRGIYAGAVGYFGATGTMDTCIALRTAVLKDDRIYIQAGGGVVADSLPEGEYQECRNKARALVRAAEEAVRFASQKSNI